jgi:hypothetical protein
MLDKLRLDPKVHSMINDYIDNGFFIITEDFSVNGKKFVKKEII